MTILALKKAADLCTVALAGKCAIRPEGHRHKGGQRFGEGYGQEYGKVDRNKRHALGTSWRIWQTKGKLFHHSHPVKHAPGRVFTAYLQ